MFFHFTNVTVYVFLITGVQEAYVFKQLLKVVCNLKTNEH